MNELEYSKFVEWNFKIMDSKITTLLHASVGLSGEAGELLDSVKKSWVNLTELNTVNLIEELGDVLFYLTAAARELGVSLEYLRDENVRKITKRYPRNRNANE